MQSAVLHHPPTGRVMLVIDQPVLARYVRLALSHGTYRTQGAPTIEDAQATRAQWQSHLAVVDMDLANGDSRHHLGYTSPASDRLPVIARTRRGDLQTTLAAFDAGVDDILTVPFAPAELVARLRAVMRRSDRAVRCTPVLHLGDLDMDLVHRRVRAGGVDRHLTSVEQSVQELPCDPSARADCRQHPVAAGADTRWRRDRHTAGGGPDAQMRGCG